MLEINPGLIIWTTVTFFLLLFVLKKIAWKHIVGALEQREEHIRLSLERAEEAKQEAERLLEENRKERAQSEERAQKILNEGRTLGENLKNEIVEKANQQARKMIDQAKQEIERDKEAALSQLREEVASLAIMAAEKILGESLDANKHKKLVDDVLNRLPRN
jgi:F-type H+-transporting ATPase subunit b